MATAVVPATGRRVRHLEKLLATLSRYVVMNDEQRLVTALWIVHTHLAEHVRTTPYLAVTSPEKQCGKSTLLDLLELLVAKPFKCVLPSAAVLYRVVGATQPTLLMDEVDMLFDPKHTSESVKLIQAVLNSGFVQGATVPRLANFTELEVHSTFCAKVLAGIGTLPDTITDRSIPIRLQRRKRSEPVCRFRIKHVAAECEPLREAMAVWGERYGETVASMITGDEVVLPEALSDRQQDAAEPLLAIADLLGYGDEARAAIVALCTAERYDSQERAQVRLLRDVRTVFADNRAMSTDQIVLGLSCLDGSDWASWFGRGIEARDIAALLKPYEVHPKTVRIATGETKKGYHRDDLAPAWERYLGEDEEPTG